MHQIRHSAAGCRLPFTSIRATKNIGIAKLTSFSANSKSEMGIFATAGPFGGWPNIGTFQEFETEWTLVAVEAMLGFFSLKFFFHNKNPKPNISILQGKIFGVVRVLGWVRTNCNIESRKSPGLNHIDSEISEDYYFLIFCKWRIQSNHRNTGGTLFPKVFQQSENPWIESMLLATFLYSFLDQQNIYL